MATRQNPVIVIPGITATDFHDDYPHGSDHIWSMVFSKDFERIALHPDDLRYEARQPARVRPGRAFPIYDDLVDALRHELSPRADQPTPVFLFPYDWRRDIRDSAGKLGDFVQEVLSRTRLLKHYARADRLRVDLVGHSMGGLIITEYLSQAGRRSDVGKVATIGTPFRGSIEAVVKITTGMSLLAGSEPQEREREAARVTPAVYQLFPWFSGAAFRAEGGPDVDLLDPANMQSSVVDSLEEFVRLYAVDTPATRRRDRAREILAELLDGGAAMRATVQGLRLPEIGMKRSDWLAIAGIGENTRNSIEVQPRASGHRFVIRDEQFQSDIPSRATGDHTVPLAAALPPFLPDSHVVCVMQKDLGILELGDRALVSMGGFHGLMPKVNLVQRLVTRFLRPDYRGPVWGRPVPRCRSWNPPIDGIEQKEGY